VRPPPDLRSEPWFDREGYPFASRHLELPAAGEGPRPRLHYLDEGEGPPVVVVGGTPGWSYEWRHVVQRLAGRFRVIVPDHLGMGLSDRHGDPRYPLAGHRENLAALLSALDIRRSHWLLHDFGGPIGIPVLTERPESVDRLVVMNSWMWDFGAVQPSFSRQRRVLESRLMGWLYRSTNLSPGFLMRRVRGSDHRLDRVTARHYTAPFPDSFHRAQVHAFLRSLLEEGSALEAAWRDGAPLRGVRTLLLWGMADPLVPPSHLERWRGDLPGARVEALQGVGHFPHEEVPERVGSLLEGFLGEE
jgi:pimeloyl-ACP methyl ester carboxylesterase